MLQTEKQLKKIIKESSHILLKEFLDSFLPSADGDGDFGGFGNYASSSYDVQIDNMIIPKTNDPLEKKKNHIIIQSIILLAESDSKFFSNFFKNSFKNSEINDDFLEKQEELREKDLNKIQKHIKEWVNDLKNEKFKDKEPINIYNAANRKLMSYLNDFKPVWPILWIFLRDAKSILREVIKVFNADNSSFWDTNSINNFEISQLNQSGQDSLQKLLIKKFEQLKLSENDINEMGTDIGGNEEIDEITGYIITILTFVFGDEIRPVAIELGKALKESMGTFENISKNVVNNKDITNKTNEKQIVADNIEKINNTELIKKMADGKSTSIEKSDVNDFLQKLTNQ